MKIKTFKKIISAVIAVVFVFALTFGGYIVYRLNCDKSDSAYKYEEVYTEIANCIYADESGYVKILKINDTHLLNGTCENDVKTLAGIKKVLDSVSCDLIIVNGDLVEGFNLKSSYDKYNAIDAFGNLIESYNTPWTFVPGNNDSEMDGDNESVIAYMMRFKNFIYGNRRDIDGSMQFFVDVYRNEKLVHAIAVMDSNSRKIRVFGSYDYIKQSQADWLVDCVNARNVKTSVFFHMPTPQFKAAYENGKAFDGFKMLNYNDYADISENELFDKAIEGNENITLLSCAHQHGNNMCSFYNGRYYQLSTVSGYNAGRPAEAVPGCTLTTIDVNCDNVEQMYNFEQINFE